MYKKIFSLVAASLLLNFYLNASEKSIQKMEQSNINHQALNDLLERSIKTNSDTVIILHDGKIVAKYYSSELPQLIDVMEITKPIVSLAFGILEAQKLLKTVNQNVYDFYPEWNQGKKKNITIKDLLNNTSGLQDLANPNIEIVPTPDVVKLALSAELSNAPGANFFNGNKAINLLPDIVKKITKKTIDKYLTQNLFKNLSIKGSKWELDKSGNILGYTGLKLYPEDLANIGQFVLQRGEWKNKQVMSNTWFDLSLQQSQPFNPLYGYFWNLIPASTSYVIDDMQIESLRNSKVSEEFISKVVELKGTYKTIDKYHQKLETFLGPDWHQIVKNELKGNATLARQNHGTTIGYKATGRLGQYLVIYPDKKLVGVRLITEKPDAKQSDNFNDFADLLYKLID
ncbi:MAG: serine hydrolase [Candidatus Babeliales bacterium]|nr:serine hydrolase [Candidatus Babeliales bacterium]